LEGLSFHLVQCVCFPETEEGISVPFELDLCRDLEGTGLRFRRKTLPLGYSGFPSPTFPPPPQNPRVCVFCELSFPPPLSLSVDSPYVEKARLSIPLPFPTAFFRNSVGHVFFPSLRVPCLLFSSFPWLLFNFSKSVLDVSYRTLCFFHWFKPKLLSSSPMPLSPLFPFPFHFGLEKGIIFFNAFSALFFFFPHRPVVRANLPWTLHASLRHPFPTSLPRESRVFPLPPTWGWFRGSSYGVASYFFGSPSMADVSAYPLSHPLMLSF